MLCAKNRSSRSRFRVETWFWRTPEWTYPMALLLSLTKVSTIQACLARDLLLEQVISFLLFFFLYFPFIFFNYYNISLITSTTILFHYFLETLVFVRLLVPKDDGVYMTSILFWDFFLFLFFFIVISFSSFYLLFPSFILFFFDNRKYMQWGLIKLPPRLVDFGAVDSLIEEAEITQRILSK